MSSPDAPRSSSIVARRKTSALSADERPLPRVEPSRSARSAFSSCTAETESTGAHGARSGREYGGVAERKATDTGVQRRREKRDTLIPAAAAGGAAQLAALGGNLRETLSHGRQK